jgi:hypothetical protein
MSTTSSRWAHAHTALLVVALILIAVALAYAVKCSNNTSKGSSNSGKSGFCSSGTCGGGGRASASASAGPRNPTMQQLAQGTHYGINTNDRNSQSTSDYSGNWWNNNTGMNNNQTYDGNDAGNYYNGSAQSQCGPPLVAESAHSFRSASSSSPSMVPSSVAMAGSFPDETASVSLAGKTTYSCAPDVTNVGGCDYALNPDNLMPGSWRAGTGCSDGTDPNSQWAKYHPTREKYYRYITAAGSARLSINTRTGNRKVLGIPLLLRSATTTPISSSEVVFSDSALRQDAVATATGSFPTSAQC